MFISYISVMVVKRKNKIIDEVVGVFCFGEDVLSKDFCEFSEYIFIG